MEPNTERPGALRSTIAWATGAALLAVLVGPGVVAVLRGGENVARAAAIERRRPTPEPGSPWSASPFPRRFDPWFDDAFGGRETALRANARLSRDAFGTSPAGYLVFGRDGWIFSRESDSFESFAGVAPLGPERLTDRQRALEDRSRWLADRGIEHLVVFVPHKASIYPEKLPAAIERAHGTSRLEEFVAWMHERSQVRVLDIAPALREAKSGDGPWRHVYSPHGVHWSGIGGHAAYEVIVGELARAFDAPAAWPLGAFEVVDQDGEGDSWASRMLLDGVIDMENLALVPTFETGLDESRRPPGSTARDYAASHGDASRPRILMVHDSFGPDIRRLIALHASYLEARWTPYLRREDVERVRPDVVIELFSELALVTRPPFRRAEFVGQATRDRYAASKVARRLDLSQPLTFAPHPERVRSEIADGAARITIERGVGYLPLGEIPERGKGGEVFVGLRLQGDRQGTIALYCGPELTRSPDLSALQPIEVSLEEQLAIVPLPRVPPGTRAWLVLPKAIGTLTLAGAELRLFK